MIETFDIALPHGITLSCRASGPQGAPVLVFLHGFPEAAFVWDEMLEHFGTQRGPSAGPLPSRPSGGGSAYPTNRGQAYRCIAPNLRGYERSSAPAGVEAYRPKHLVADMSALIERLGGRLAALVAHDWGGAVAWNLAVQHPALIERLVIINSPHPATFLRALQTDPAQQAASQYMNLLRSPEAEGILSANDFKWLLARFRGSEWMTESMKERYLEVWRQGLTGALNYYRASPLYPPTATDSSVMSVQFPPEFVTVRVPTRVLWGEEDKALLPSLLEGLEAFVPHMTLVRLPGASHWVVHEQPARIASEIEAALAA